MGETAITSTVRQIHPDGAGNEARDHEKKVLLPQATASYSDRTLRLLRCQETRT